MSILTRWLLIPPVNARLIGRYRDYRRHGASAFSATLGCFWMILAWIFIPLEHPRWQRIRAEHRRISVSVFAGHAGWCKSSVSITRLPVKG
ncbi:TPA: hypothetical protein ACHGHT_000796 [Escherichia coli]